jgi:hypothetical protein
MCLSFFFDSSSWFPQAFFFHLFVACILYSLLWSLNLFMWVRVCVSAFDAPHPLSMLCSKIKPRKGEEKKSLSFCNLLQGWYRGRSITVRFKRSLLDSRLAINLFFLYSYHYMFFFFLPEQQAIKERKGKERKGNIRIRWPLGGVVYH